MFVKLKQISSSSQTHMRVTVSMYKNMLITVCVYVRNAHSVLRVCMIRKRVAFAYLNTGNIQKTIVCTFFIHGNVQLMWVSDTHAWTLLLVSDMHTQLFPFARACFCVVKSPPNISSISCHCALCAALQSQGRSPSMLPGGGKFCKKTQICFSQGEYGMLRQYYLRIY